MDYSNTIADEIYRNTGLNLSDAMTGMDALSLFLKEYVRSEVERILNGLLEHELDLFLDYERYARSDNPDSRNGSYTRKYDTPYGIINVRMPRDRFGDFESALLPKYGRRDGATEETVMKLFEEGMTDSEIAAIIEHLCGARYSRQTISNITERAVADIAAFKSRALQKEYAVIFLDGTSMALRRDTVEKECVHIALGITPEGGKEILGYAIAPNESAEQWRMLLEDLKERGAERVSLFCTDGLSGMEEAIADEFPGASIQRCLAHVQRNIYAKARKSDHKELAADFKKTYRQDDEASAHKALDEFCRKWQKRYPSIAKMLRNNGNMYTFYKYPKSVRGTIYTTNLIEGYNKQLKRNFKKKEQFPNEAAEEKYLVCEFNKYNAKQLDRVHKGFGQTTRSDWFKD